MAEEHERQATVTVGTSAELRWRVLRGLEPVRLAVLALILSIAVGVGDWVEGSWWVQLLAALATFAVVAVLLRVNRTRDLLFRVADWVVGD